MVNSVSVFSSCEFVVVQHCLLCGPSTKLLKYKLKLDLVCRLEIGELLLNVEVFDELAFHLEESVKRDYIILRVFFLKVGLIRLHAEVLIHFLFAQIEEPSDLLNARMLLESFLVFQFVASAGIISHQKLSQEYTWVESFSNVVRNFSFGRIH